MMHFFKEKKQIVKTIHFKKCHDHWINKQINKYNKHTFVFGSKFETVLESVSRRLHSCMELYTYWMFFPMYYCIFWNKYCNLSTEMRKVRPHFLYGISRLLQNTTWDHRYWRIVCEKMPNPCLKCTLSILSGFNFFGILKSAKSFRKVDEIHNCLQPMSKSLSLWFSPIGGQEGRS